MTKPLQNLRRAFGPLLALAALSVTGACAPSAQLAGARSPGPMAHAFTGEAAAAGALEVSVGANPLASGMAEERFAEYDSAVGSLVATNIEARAVMGMPRPPGRARMELGIRAFTALPGLPGTGLTGDSPEPPEGFSYLYAGPSFGISQRIGAMSKWFIGGAFDVLPGVHRYANYEVDTSDDRLILTSDEPTDVRTRLAFTTTQVARVGRVFGVQEEVSLFAGVTHHRTPSAYFWQGRSRILQDDRSLRRVPVTVFSGGASYMSLTGVGVSAEGGPAVYGLDYIGWTLRSSLDIRFAL